ncbi:uncharacterized protein G6M90_00g034220 [Metarhizium brunneum]|uniref:Uncharacterized protein n=1 Tax=Metarhizium brunneum TaxID=500148 RepID=A0A7D5UV41_9HYPO|nr:hypothetical protein G6M90_00g034220 [Metarhizium brunneum]
MSGRISKPKSNTKKDNGRERANLIVTRLLEQQKKLESEEEEAGNKLLELHTQLADLQSQLFTAVNRLARIRKIRNRVKDKSSELFRRGMAELDAEDGILPALDAHER